MAVKHSANVSAMNFIFRNEDHRTNFAGTTYLGTQLPDIEGDFTIAGWFRLFVDEYLKVWTYSGLGPNPPYISLESVTEYGGQDWWWRYSATGTDRTEIKLGNVTIEEWIYICYRRSGDTHSVFLVKETDPLADVGPAVLAFTPPHEVHLQFPFDQFTLQLGRGMSVCSLKIWNVALTDAQVNANRAEWIPTVPAVFNTHLRRTGDLLNSVAVVPNDFWHDNFEWTEAPDLTLLSYFTDPFILQNKQCSTFLVPTVGVEFAMPRVAEFQCPPGFTAKYATDPTYFQLEDRTTVPLNYADTPVGERATYQSVTLYGFPQHQGIKRQLVPVSSVPATVNYVAYISDLGVKTETTTILDSSGLNIMGLVVPDTINIAGIYLWKWGSGFVWNNTLGAVAKAYPGEFRQPVVVVHYKGTWEADINEKSSLRISQLAVEVIIGFPGEDEPENGVITPPGPRVVTIGGVYFFNPVKSEWHDTYYGKELKIPDPTIKTGLIGE